MKIDFFDVSESLYVSAAKRFLADESTKEVNLLFTSFVGFKNVSKLKSYCRIIVEYSEQDLPYIPELINDKRVHFLVKKGDDQQFADALQQVYLLANEMKSEMDLAFLFFRLSHDLILLSFDN